MDFIAVMLDADRPRPWSVQEKPTHSPICEKCAKRIGWRRKKGEPPLVAGGKTE
ncbi:hypothetical protein [Crenobacter cavernae]|uniref:hypothetical protein n=1 Tax=Crenobacter cavernae TaxID=2290923 RepID=UPI0015F14292|nr:hypothetical protein [Crenobacter cavernae]